MYGHVCFIAQPRSVFGSPEDLVERGTRSLAEQTAALGRAIVDRIGEKTGPKAIRDAIDAAGRAWPRERFAEPLSRELERGLMLGALDSDWEARNNERIAPASFAELHAPRLLREGDTDPAFAKRPQIDAGRAFIEKDIVTRDVFDSMTKSAQRRSFTVANATTNEVVRSVKRELVRQIAKGADLRDFRKFALQRLESAGWTPINPSHAEVVFRTNVATAYNSGRYRQMSQPKVLALRPFWQIITVNDGPPRQRKTHRAAHLVVLAADDEFWQTGFAPFGFNCRCRVRSLSRRQAEAIGVSKGSQLRGLPLPDPGFASGVPRLL